MRLFSSWKKRWTRKSSINNRRLASRIFRPRLEALEDRTVPSQFLVTSNLDDGSAGTLRWAIDQANAVAGADEIAFDTANLFARPQTITVRAGGLPGITDDLRIVGPGADKVTVKGNNFSGFSIRTAATVSMSGLTIADFLAPFGGAILNDGTLTVDHCLFVGNSAGAGGAILNDGVTTISNSTFSSNLSYHGNGAALWNAGGLATVINSTFTGNSGGSIKNDYGGTLTVSGSTFTGNTGADLSVVDVIGVTETVRVGSGIYNTNGGRAHITRSTLSNNIGTAIFNYHNPATGSTLPTVTVSDCTITGNHAEVGGGVASWGGVAQVDHCTFSRNSAGGSPFSGGGGLNAARGGTLVVSNSTFSDNLAGYNQAGNQIGGGYGGGLSVAEGSTATVTNSTFAGNRAYFYGGGIFYYLATTTVTNSTLSGNIAVTGGGGGIFEGGTHPTVGNTIIAGNFGPAAPDFAGRVVSQGYNLIGNGSGSSGFGAAGDQVGTATSPIDPLLAPLGNYGRPTQTMPLLPGSPALGAGNVALAVDASGNPLTTDQRGKPRVVNGLIDIGACERQLATVVVNGYTGVYDGQPHGLSGSATGDLGEDLTPFLLLGPAFVDAGTYVVPWDFSAPNYPPAHGDAQVVIDKVQPTVTAIWSGWTYDGTAHAASGSVSGVGSPAEDLGAPRSFTYYVGTGTDGTNLGGTAPTDAGTYTVVAHYAGSANYTAASATATITILPAPLTVKVSSSLMLAGNSPPALTGSVNGNNFTGTTAYTTAYGDSVNVTLGTAATSGSTVGQYGITASLSGAKAADYFIDPASSANGTMYVVSVGADPTSTTGAEGVVFWDNRGNAKLITAADLSALDALFLVSNNGKAFDPKAVAQLQAWLQLASATSSNMAYQLSVQLAVMDLNVLTGYVQTTDLVYAGGLLPYATGYGLTGLTSGGFISIGNLMASANAALQLDPTTFSGDPYRAYEAALTAALQAANNNNSFVQQEVTWNLTSLYQLLTS